MGAADFISNMNLEQRGNPLYYDLKDVCRNACPFGITIEYRPALCAEANRGKKCLHFTPCSECNRNTDLIEGTSVCVPCAEHLSKQEKKQGQILERGLVESSALSTRNDFTREEQNYYDEQFQRIWVEMLQKNPAARLTVEWFIRTEIDVKRKQNALYAYGPPTTRTRPEVLAKIDTLRRMIREDFETLAKIATHLGIAPQQEKDRRTQFDEAFSTMVFKHREYLREFGIGMASEEDREYAARSSNAEITDGPGGTDMREFQISLDGRLIDDKAAREQSERLTAEFEKAVVDGDKKKQQILMCRNCWLDPVLGAVTLLWWTPTIWQRVAMRKMWVSKLSSDSSGAGMGKTRMHAAAAILLRLITMQDRQCLVIAGSLRQGEQYYDSFEAFKRNSPVFASQIAMQGGREQLKTARGSFRLDLKNYSGVEIVPPGWSTDSVQVKGQDVNDLVLSEVNEFPKQEIVESVFFMRGRRSWLRGWQSHPIFCNKIFLEGTPGDSENDPSFRRIAMIRQLREDWRRLRETGCKSYG